MVFMASFKSLQNCVKDNPFLLAFLSILFGNYFQTADSFSPNRLRSCSTAMFKTLWDFRFQIAATPLLSFSAAVSWENWFFFSVSRVFITPSRLESASLYRSRS